ncbi:YtxH domain-containing protein [Terribacillus aidingensis]|uniref:YtxH domain-containing protein n=1 Tax=Terribacillus aidingensis TaxID=586416 RepID=UPI00344D588F
MSEMKDKVVNKAVVKTADKVRKVDNTWNRTIAGGIAGASIGLLTSPNIGKKIAGTFKSAKTKVTGKDLGESVKQMKDQTINMVQDKFKKDKSSDEDNNTEEQEEKNENDKNHEDNQNDKNNQDKQDDSNNQENQDDNNNQDKQKDPSSQNNQANENLRDENEHLKQKIEELENKLNQLLNDNSSKEEDTANSNGITIVRQDDVTK